LETLNQFEIKILSTSNLELFSNIRTFYFYSIDIFDDASIHIEVHIDRVMGRYAPMVDTLLN